MLKEIQGKKWLLTSKGAFLLSGTTARLSTPSDLECFDVISFENDTILATNRGLFAVFEDGAMQLNVTQESDRISALLQRILRWAYVTGSIRLHASYWTSQVTVSEFLKTRGLNPTFNAIVASTENDLEDLSRQNQWRPLDAISFKLSFGANELHIRVRDQWGNELRDTKKLWAFPRSSLVTAIVTAFGCAFIIFCFLSFRRFAFSRRVLFNPFLNLKWLGLVPLAVSLCPPVRSYLLVLYSRTLAAKAADRVSNSAVANVLDKLLTTELLEKTAASHRTNIVVKQQAGLPNLSLFTLRLIQKLYFDSPAFHMMLPYVAVFLDMIHNADKSVGQVFAGTMESYGRIDNDRLNEKLFAQDGYHFFICTDKAFEELPGFIDEHEEGNKITVVSNSILSELDALNIQPIIVDASAAIQL